MHSMKQSFTTIEKPPLILIDFINDDKPKVKQNYENYEVTRADSTYVLGVMKSFQSAKPFYY